MLPVGLCKWKTTNTSLHFCLVKNILRTFEAEIFKRFKNIQPHGPKFRRSYMKKKSAKKVVIVKSRHKNRKELWGSTSKDNVLLLFVSIDFEKSRVQVYIMPRPDTYTTSFVGALSLIPTVTTFAGSHHSSRLYPNAQSSFRFQNGCTQET